MDQEYWFKIVMNKFKKINLMNNNFFNEKEQNYDNDGLDPSEEYFRKKKKGNDEDTYFLLEESEPPHY